MAIFNNECKTDYSIIVNDYSFIMNNRLQFKLAGPKAQFGNNKTIPSLKELIHTDQQYEQLRQIKVSYCERLISLEGIQRLHQVRELYISSNSIASLMGLRAITNLQVLQAKNNKINSLEGLQHFTKLQKIIAPYNLITNLEPLVSFHSHHSLSTLILFANQIHSLQQIQHLQPFTQLAQIVFETQGDGNKDTTKHPLLKDIKNVQHQVYKGNPVCRNRPQYQNVLRESLIQSIGTLQKIDDMTGKALVKFMNQGKFYSNNQNSSEFMANTGNVQLIRNKTTQYKKNNDKKDDKQLYTLQNQELMLMTQRQADLQRILDIKQDTICELKSKLNTLQMTHAVQFKDSLKKQAQYERSLGQLGQLAKQIELKDSQINQLHRRIEDLFKTNANNNILTDTKSQQLQKTRKELVDLKIQNARLTALNTHFQSSTRDLQQKALFNFEQKSRRMQQLRHRNEQLIKDQLDMQKELNQYRDRVRQLTQLLKQWQFKFEKKISQLQTYHNSQRGQLINQMTKQEEENRHAWEQQMRRQSAESEQKMKVLEEEYSKVLDDTLHKYKQLKDMYDHKSHSQVQAKSYLKSLLNKNAEYQNHLKQFEEIIIASRNNITKITQENDYLIKQCQQVRTRWAHESQTLKAELSKYQFSCEKMQAEVKDLKINNDYLQKNFDHFSLREKQMEEMIERTQNLQTALDAKNIMLDDKNQTIQSLKQQLQGLQKQQEQQVDAKQFDKISKKYSRQKQILKNLQEQISNLTEQNKELTDKMQVFASMQQQFNGIRQIISKQQLQIKQKSQAVDQLTEYLHKLKQIVENLTLQNKNVRLQINKQLQSYQIKQQKMMRVAKDKQNQYERKLIAANQEMVKYKGFAEQLQNFTKNLNL